MDDKQLKPNTNPAQPMPVGVATAGPAAGAPPAPAAPAAGVNSGSNPVTPASPAVTSPAPGQTPAKAVNPS